MEMILVSLLHGKGRNMRYEDMTVREQRLSHNAICPFCRCPITRLEDVQIVKIRYGKRIIPAYMHTSCLLNTMLSSQLEEGINYETCEKK